MHELDEVFQFILDALSANANRGYGSVVSVKVAPYSKGGQSAGHERRPRAITQDDVLDAHEVLKTFDGNFRKLFEARKHS